MKKPKSKYTKIAITVVISAAILYAIMMVIDNIGLVYDNISSAVSFVLRILSPVLIGLLFAFLLHRPTEFFARVLQKCKFFIKRQRTAIVFGVFITFVLFIALITAFLYLLIPSVIQSISSIGRDLPGYANKVYNWGIELSKTKSVTQFLDYFNIKVTDAASINAFITESWAEITKLLQGLASAMLGFIVNTGRFLYNFVLGLFFTIYMLLYKKQIKNQIKLLSKAIFKSFYYKLAFTYRVANDMFYKFLSGKALCSIGVGIVTFLICAFGGFRYAALIGLILGVTNMIPVFGPFIGAIPAILLAMMTSPIYGLYMFIIIIVIQFVDANIAAPRVLGYALGINGFWVIFSIIIMGALFGIIGMLIAAPLFALIRILLKNWLVKRDKEYEKLEAAAEYNASLIRYYEWTSKKIKNNKNRSKKNAKL